MASKPPADSHVDIGYLEKCESWKLKSCYFPSKVGGKPAWLDLKDISVELLCESCGDPTVFLCQMYAPIPSLDSCFHRMLYVFICRNAACCKPGSSFNFRAFRCQLPDKNSFYRPGEPPLEPKWSTGFDVEEHCKTCVLCGSPGPHRCAKCTAQYCSKQHQVIHWKSGHKENCSRHDSQVDTTILFPEFEILTEPEEDDNDLEESTSVNEEKIKDEDQYKEYEELVKSGRGGTMQDVPSDVFEQLALSSKDKYFNKYKERLSMCPDQVVRYERGGEPLWIAKPNNVIPPPCEYCHAERQFECQILSTMLNYLEVDSLNSSIDWGSLILYTCSSSCDGGPAYKKEFLLKQDIESQ